MAAQVRSPVRLLNRCDSTDGTQQMQWCVCHCGCRRRSHVDVCHVWHLMHQSPLKWGRLFPPALGIFSPPPLQFPHRHVKSGEATVTEVCEWNWPWLNLDLLLVFPDSTLTLDIPADRGAAGNIFLFGFGSWLQRLCQCQQHALRRLPCRKSAGSFSFSLTSPLSSSSSYMFFLINHVFQTDALLKRTRSGT